MFVERLHPELGRLARPGAGLRASHDEVGLAADRGGHAPTCGANLLLRLLARHRFERPGQNEALVPQGGAPLCRWSFQRLEIEMLHQPLDRFAVARLVEGLADAARELGAAV